MPVLSDFHPERVPSVCARATVSARVLLSGALLVTACASHRDTVPEPRGSGDSPPPVIADQTDHAAPPAPSEETREPSRGVAEDATADASPPKLDYDVPSGPVLSPELLGLRAAAQARILGRGAEIVDAAGELGEPTAPDPERENGNALGGFVPIENEAALAAFHEALAQLERGTLPGGKLRILAYGASHTQADVYPGYLRHYLQSRFGDAGPGFVQLVPLDKWHRPRAAELSSQRFSVHHAQRRPGMASTWFGLSGAVGVASTPGAFARAELRQGPPEGTATEIDVYAMGHPGGGELRLLVDDRERARWSTHAEPPRPVFLRSIETAPFQELTVEVTGTGTVRLLGATVEWDRPGVVVDTLGISGTRAANWLAWDEAAWSEQVQRRHPALVLLAYGTNESSDEQQPIAHYEQQLREVLERLRRAAPQASCLLVGPGDAAKKVGGKWVARKRLLPIIEVQRRQALEHGCGFWDAHAFMGDGGISRWARAMPPMASADLIHLTRRGYVKLGMTLGDALLRAYDAAQLPTRAPAPTSLPPHPGPRGAGPKQTPDVPSTAQPFPPAQPPPSAQPPPASESPPTTPPAR